MDGLPVLLLAGPTASGKSALALDWAERVGGELINADSQQLYRDLRVLSARPGPADEARAGHHLYGVADAAEAWSVGRWLRTVLPLLRSLQGQGRPVVVVGGTGLYFRALTHGLAEIPPVAAEARDAAQRRFEHQGEDAFRRALAAQDPAAA
ncbi:MAG: tRNA (adenosine(37)-N6)-dimethylallyltransferase MiaA, partial [Pseudomonadota bacterium]|nr:tRNA (adenosine(37)-N6)-dimethylallyltransferase MiaA [Pseudomonadota bacterium]